MHKYGLSRAFASITQPFGIDRRECVKAAGDNLKKSADYLPTRRLGGLTR